MKKYLVFGMMSAIALTFTACSTSDEDLALQDNLEKGVVKTQFNIAIPAQTKTRMSEANTQAQSKPTFRGMEKIHLIPFAKKAKITATDNRLGNELTLNTTGAVPTIEAVNTIKALNANNNSQLYKDVEVPIGTRSFLFYGVAPDEGNKADVYGQLNATGLENTVQTPDGIKFELQSIIASNASTDSKATNIVTYLNLIAKDNDWEKEDNPLHDMYTNFISLKAGSSADVQALVQDLYTSLQTKSDATSAKIKEDITKATYASDTNGKLTFTEAISGYPANIKLPDGAALVAWDAANGFQVATALEYKNSSGAQLFNVPTLQDYVFPASLYYRANSLINTANTSKAEFYSGENAKSTWKEVLDQYENKLGAVSGETKSVAIVDQIEYAVARMDLKVKAGAATLQDKESKSFNASDMQVTGLLIGGQKQVNFEFLPVSSASEKTIYDNQVESNITLSTSETLANRTLVLETADDAEVKFAIEFLNKGKAFRGFDGIVPKNCKFYLIGSINPATSGGTALVGDRAKDKAGNEIIRVFLQDFVTTVSANISSLKNAYNVIPDLRAPQLELGLSVNLNWEAANTYSVTLD
ncbi:MAG: hypothetical protein IJ551_09045 [Prevotella sp.]|nr:hypothetical protein [Prevotella sp.]